MTAVRDEQELRAADPHTPTRLAAVDVFRGLTVAGMILVNNPGDWGQVYGPLRHAAWHGWTPTDLIFPFFLFIVGITTTLSLGARRERGATDGELATQIIRRGVIIIALGLLVSAFPFVPPEHLARLRIPGVLQRIGIAYLAAALVVLHGTRRAQLLIAGAILLGYWALLALVPVPGTGYPALEPPAVTLPAWLDRRLLNGHLWAATRTWDPEGVLSTFPAIASVLLGALAAPWLRGARPPGERARRLALAGAGAALAGLAWGLVFPINKNLWTSSFALVAAGAGALALGACIWLIEARGIRGWIGPFLAFGVNPIVAFVGSAMLSRLLYTTLRVQLDGADISLQQAIYRTLFASWLPPKPASLAFALAMVALWWAVLALLDKRGIRLKV
ncbi:MAG TPA: heparan-alpha-glucosaminide N-acetyltransferase domain-containing protein [Gemmatimonadales bacterium]|nr:heparan-alpha-glucosaminide N-acetyltransferase domain-containing protein [Gemmatimonadales bacterium]